MVDLCRSVEAAMSDALQAVLSQLDQWRHLPKYRLEQHVDVLFGMTLPKVLSSRFGIPVDDLQVIPEFPIRYGTLASRHQGKATDDQSFNVDFSVWSKSRERVFLVELKTDAGSLDVKQLCKMVEVKEHGGGFGDFVGGVIQISRVTRDRRKYAQLIWRLHEVGAVSVPPRFRELQMEDDRPSLGGDTGVFRCCHPTENYKEVKAKLVLVCPPIPESKKTEVPDGICCIDFRDYAHIVHGTGTLESTFAYYLLRWQCPAGITNPWQRSSS